MRVFRFGRWLVPLLLLLVGCESRPKAPALRDAPVFHSKQEGFRFLVPEGWKQHANGALPAGKLEGVVLFAQYRMPNSKQGAMLDLLCFSEGKYASPQEYHAGPSHGVREWKLVGSPDSLEVNGTRGDRFIFSATLGKQPMVKEAVVYQRNQRVYSFIGVFSESDNVAREELRRAMNSIVWEG